MIRAIIFDFDGTLCELVEVHYQSLNSAIETTAGKEFIISRQEHDSFYNGLSTKTKLNHLVKNKGLSHDLIDDISDLKQQFTLRFIESNIVINAEMQKNLQKLKSEGFLIACASNAKYDTVELGLKKLGIFDCFDYIVGNDNIKNQKPSPDIYFHTFSELSLDPKQCLIVEDSKNGRVAAIKSGAYVCTVDDESDTTYEHISKSISKIKPMKTRWVDSKLKVVIPMSGNGKRFKEAGFELPKPLISVNGKPMIKYVLDCINVDAEIIFIVQKQHYDTYNLQYLLESLAPECKIILEDGNSLCGAANSVLLAKEHINTDDHLFIINSDQYLDWDSSDFFNKMLTSKCDGGIITFHKENDPKWSYVKLENDLITEVREKQPISNLATVGGYFYAKGSDFVQATEEMIAANDRTNNEFYVAPTYNYLINKGKKIIPYTISTGSFWGLGVPEDLDNFLKNFK